MEDKKLLDKIEKKIIQILKKEGGAAGLDPLKKAVDKMDQPKGFNLKSILKKMKNVEKHKNSDYILTPINENNGAMKKSKKGMAMYGKKMNQESLEELKGLFEKLCKKGQAYRRKRMAAGEKSSAYLSGRAVKVCKGQMKGEGLEEDMDPREVNVFGYQTKHFDVCPGAQGLYKKITKEFDGDKDLAIRSAKLHDVLFAMEKNAIEMGGNELDIQSAQIIADQIMEMAKMMGLEKEHDYVQNHVNIIRDSINKKK